MKRPAFQFYPGDWVRDPVAGCSLAAQGLWLRMMVVAHDSDRYGFLSQNGAPIPPDAISRRCGCESITQYEALLAELFQAGVPSRTPEGVIFSRRMVRDEELRETRASGGVDSLNHPNVHRPKKKDGGKDTPKGTYKDGGKDTSKDGAAPQADPSLAPSFDPSFDPSLGVSPSSSSSSSSSYSTSTSNRKVKTLSDTPSKNDGASLADCVAAVPFDWIPKDAWQGFVEMRRKQGAPLTDHATKLIVGKLETLRTSGQNVGEVLDQSTLNGWKGIFAVDERNRNGYKNRAAQRTADNLAALDAACPLDR